MKISVQSMSTSYGGPPVLKNINLNIAKSSLISVIGANGSGKSTLLRTLCRLLKIQSGYIYIDKKNILSYSKKELAKKISFLPQYKFLPEDMTVYELVSYGRFPHSSFLRNTKQDKESIAKAIALTHLEKLQNRKVSTLSGGERQRAWIALCIAQEAEIMLLDEPTTYLDIKCQMDVMELILNLNHELATTILMTLHDINHAAHYSNRVIAIKNGEIFADGSVSSTINEELILKVFGARVKTLICDGIPYFIPTTQQKNNI